MVGVVFHLLAGVAPALAGSNVLLIVVDDIGRREITASGIAPAGGRILTPRIDTLAASGMHFPNAYAQPLCSPSRIAIHLGRDALGPNATGYGQAIQWPETAEPYPDPSVETFLPEILSAAGVATAAFGKWHIGGEWPLAPLLAGYQHFAGVRQNVGITGGEEAVSYFEYSWNVDGVVTEIRDEYLTSRTVDEAVRWIEVQEGQWFAYVAFNAAHQPYHEPPVELHSGDLPAEPTDKQLYRAMVEAVDTEIGRLLSAVPPGTVVIFTSDNGTSGLVMDSGSPYQFRGKGTLYQGGINVPLFVAGAGVPKGVTDDSLVTLVDLFDTVLSLAEVDPALWQDLPRDSIGFAELLRGRPREGTRDLVHTAAFEPNGLDVERDLQRYAIHDGSYKLIRRVATGVEFFDLVADPYETVDLLPDLDPDQQEAHDRLEAALRAYIRRELPPP